MKTRNLLMLLVAMLALGACESNDIEGKSFNTVAFYDLRDQDNDGVINSRDICDQSPQNGVIDGRGCAEAIVAEKKVDFVIPFEFDSAEFPPAEQHKIRAVKQLVDAHDGARVYLVGDTSSEGGDDYNKALGKRRADSLMDQLLTEGVPLTQISEFVYNENPVKNLLKKRERRTIMRVVYREQDYVERWSIYQTEAERSE